MPTLAHNIFIHGHVSGSLQIRIVYTRRSDLACKSRILKADDDQDGHYVHYASGRACTWHVQETNLQRRGAYDTLNAAQ